MYQPQTIFKAAVPDPGAGSIPDILQAHVDLILGWTAGLALAACVGLLIFNFVKMGIAKHQGQTADVSGPVMVGIAVIGVVSAGGLVAALAA